MFLPLWLFLSSAALAEEPSHPASLERLAKPVYPESARSSGVEGEVHLRLNVDKTGAVVGVTVLSAPSETLGLSAAEAGYRLHYRPEMRDGLAVASVVEYRFRFTLGLSDESAQGYMASLIGVVEDMDGLPLPNTPIRITSDTGQSHLFQTNDEGGFRAEFLQPGEYELWVESAQFAQTSFELLLTAGETLTHRFTVQLAEEQEVLVVAGDRVWRDISRGRLEADEGTVTSYELTRRDIESTPGALEDVNRAVHALPGIVSDGDMLATFNARGGRNDEVSFLLDGVPLDNPFHLAGFNSIFNPDMIQTVQFYAGAAPADAISSTSAVMNVQSWDGKPRQEDKGLDGAVDISASSIRAMAMGAVDEDERLTFAVAARRSYMESYFQVLKALDVIDTAFAAPEFSEISARASWRVTDRHQLMFTAMRAGDSLALVDSADDSLVQFDGAFELSNRLDLLTFQHRFSSTEGFSWNTTAAYTGDASFQYRNLGGESRQDVKTKKLFARTDLSLERGKHRIKVGGHLSRSRLLVQGDLEDPSGLPSFFNGPIAEFDLSRVAVDEDFGFNRVSLYVQEEWSGPVQLRVGARQSFISTTGEWVFSPRAGLSVPLPTGTIPKISWGIYQQSPTDPRLISAEMGNPKLRSETAMHWVAGVDQAIPLPYEGVGLARIELYRIDLGRQIVHADVADGLPIYTNGGSGTNRGIDMLFSVRTGRIDGMFTYSYLRAERFNPRNSYFAQRVAPGQDQRHTVGLSTGYQIATRWRITGRYSFHTGRPVSTVGVVSETAVEPLTLNQERLNALHQLNIRAEWRRAYRQHRLSFYAEVLNILNAKSDFVPIVTVDENGELNKSMLYHLPIRPFFGLRSDF